MKKQKQDEKQKAQQLKTRVRRSREWALLRRDLFERQHGKDPITLRPLPKGYTCHHLQCEDWTKYDDLSPDKFVLVGRQMHEIIHILWNQVKREGNLKCLDRLKLILKEMMELNDVE